MISQKVNVFARNESKKVKNLPFFCSKTNPTKKQVTMHVS